MDSSVAVLCAVGDAGGGRAEVGWPDQRDSVLGGALAVGGELCVGRFLDRDGFGLVSEHTLDGVGHQHPQVTTLRSVGQRRGQPRLQ